MKTFHTIALLVCVSASSLAMTLEQQQLSRNHKQLDQSMQTISQLDKVRKLFESKSAHRDVLLKREFATLTDNLNKARARNAILNNQLANMSAGNQPDEGDDEMIAVIGQGDADRIYADQNMFSHLTLEELQLVYTYIQTSYTDLKHLREVVDQASAVNDLFYEYEAQHVMLTELISSKRADLNAGQ